MTVAFVLGNGLSRLEVDLASLKSKGMIYGCNALYREFVPDVLVATDTPISQHIQESQYALIHKFYTRYPLNDLGAKIIPDDYFTFSSGPAATGIAADAGHTTIYLIGFDMGPSKNKGYNNVYADTEFYQKSSFPPVTSVNWIRQIKFVASKFPTTKFVRLVGTTTAQIAELNNISNLFHLPLPDFVF